MCGRYYIEIDEAELRDICNDVQQRVQNPAEQLSFNMITGEVFPTNIVPVYTGVNECRAMKWGFTGFDGRPIINARSETALIKPTFKKPMLESRCLIPASGYFEWQKTDNGKQKYIFRLPARSIMYIAGCYRQEQNIGLGSFVVLTKEATGELKTIHDRMPVIIPENSISNWFSTGDDAMKNTVGDLLFQRAVI